MSNVCWLACVSGREDPAELQHDARQMQPHIVINGPNEAARPECSVGALEPEELGEESAARELDDQFVCKGEGGQSSQEEHVAVPFGLIQGLVSGARRHPHTAEDESSLHALWDRPQPRRTGACPQAFAADGCDNPDRQEAARPFRLLWAPMLAHLPE